MESGVKERVFTNRVAVEYDLVRIDYRSVARIFKILATEQNFDSCYRSVISDFVL
jgi:hypothetical protein